VVLMTKPGGMRMWRHLNAAHALGYVGLSETFTMGNFVRPLAIRYGLLNEEEMARIESLNSKFDETDSEVGIAAQREVLTWCLQDLSTDVKLQLDRDKKTKGLTTVWRAKIAPDPCALMRLIGDINTLRDKSDNLYELTEQPLPFFYLHLVFFIVTAYLPLFAYKMSRDSLTLTEEEMCGATGFGQGFCYGGLQNDVFSMLLLLMYLIVVIGLGKAGEQMTDPFGIDLVDIPVRHLVMNTTQGSLDVMKCALDKSIPSEGDEAKIATTNRWRHGAQMAVKQRKQMTAADKIKEQAMKEMAGEDVCYFCKKPGHWKQDCPDWKLNVWAATSVQAGVRGMQCRKAMGLIGSKSPKSRLNKESMVSPGRPMVSWGGQESKTERRKKKKKEEKEEDGDGDGDGDGGGDGGGC
jgi:hypothetical protein